MKNNYFFISFIVFLFTFLQYSFAQNLSNDVMVKEKIKELSVFPNPVSRGITRVNIASKTNMLKAITIYNVLGKRIRNKITTYRTLNISTLNSGVYILKITENDVSETRKLVIK